ncbi:hypothetical protein B0G62_1139 [Paraburkholderia eburnea]|uniref:Uncharacterized protein n=1 Tax=Paraburkholderia eburnea TaxID=1189126 RepID=A0A2S4M1Y1_9BURK|nr:hypothetical protein [Paraburkholderia eburnea]POR48724.1 hypothetical protein B0G62_1139 [Paraburkholderia eburnea]PRZ20839.1 hypothetical protein BX588_11073 [Paraburkholderia eburnea]
MFPLIATVSLLVMIYVHMSIPRFTNTRRKRFIAHAVLLLVGLAFGTISAMLSGAIAPPWVVIFGGMGVVHVPALCVLVLKRLKHEGQS